jgi:hypothetical protein
MNSFHAASSKSSLDYNDSFYAGNSELLSPIKNIVDAILARAGPVVRPAIYHMMNFHSSYNRRSR